MRFLPQRQRKRNVQFEFHHHAEHVTNIYMNQIYRGNGRLREQYPANEYGTKVERAQNLLVRYFAARISTVRFGWSPSHPPPSSLANSFTRLKAPIPL
jgi:hypothetical protein